MVTQFKLNFLQPHFHPITHFVKSEKELYAMPDSLITKVIENKKLELLFVSDNQNDRLFFDLLDIVIINEDEEMLYTVPSTTPLTIYDTKNYTGALIPGYYKLKVVSNGENFFSWLKILPKQITEEEWIILRDEVESELNGLARDILYKRPGFEYHNEFLLPLSLLQKIDIVSRNLSRWKSAIHNINKNPKFKIDKDYKIVPISKAKSTDHVSIKMDNMHSKSKDYIHSRFNVINFEINENIRIKKIVTIISKEVDSLIQSFDNWIIKINSQLKEKERYKRYGHLDTQLELYLNSIEELNLKRKHLKSVSNDCKDFLNTSWIQSLEISNKNLNIELAFYSNPHYRNIFQLFKALKQENFSYSLNSNYTYYWKRTDQLYEIWGVIQLIKTISSEEIGFNVLSGWIYNSKSSSKKSIEVPFLDKGTSIEFTKNDYKICLVYDDKIPSKEYQSLLFTKMKRNRPDVRLDFMIREEYIGSLIIDFKYRPLHFIWNKHKQNTEVMEQLTMYKHGIRSTQIYNLSFPGLWDQFTPIREVWAVYPTHSSNNRNGSPSHIELVELSPGYNKDDFKALLKESIDKIFNIALITK